MKRNTKARAPIELGAASDKTLGGTGQPFDLVKDIQAANGIVDD
ncbi:MAG: hypothetical protein V4696_01985 [Pseudomonadota bacterium]